MLTLRKLPAEPGPPSLPAMSHKCGAASPTGRPDTLAFWNRPLPTDDWLSYPLTTRWLPDAFIGPIRSLLAAIADGGEPAASARDSLGTLAVSEARLRSRESGHSQTLEPLH
jgi:predicted dehydrogenase